MEKFDKSYFSDMSFQIDLYSEINNYVQLCRFAISLVIEIKIFLFLFLAKKRK